jgi:hypothetical protein
MATATASVSGVDVSLLELDCSPSARARAVSACAAARRALMRLRGSADDAKLADADAMGESCDANVQDVDHDIVGRGGAADSQDAAYVAACDALASAAHSYIAAHVRATHVHCANVDGASECDAAVAGAAAANIDVGTDGSAVSAVSATAAEVASACEALAHSACSYYEICSHAEASAQWPPELASAWCARAGADGALLTSSGDGDCVGDGNGEETSDSDLDDKEAGDVAADDAVGRDELPDDATTAVTTAEWRVAEAIAFAPDHRSLRVLVVRGRPLDVGCVFTTTAGAWQI